jgi:hypothetical protein
MDPETERGWNRWFDAKLNAALFPLVDEIGKSTGTLQRELNKLRAEHRLELDALRAEIGRLRQCGLASDEALDLPDWRRRDARH